MPPAPAPKSHHTIMPLGDHLEELRRRLWYALVGVFPIFCAGLYFGKTILNFMVQPLIKALWREDVAGAIQATSVLEGFMNYLKVAMLLAVIVGGPWIIFQLWKFVAPGLYQRERRFFYFLSPMSIVLTAVGVAFMYYVMLPFVLMFFVHFNEALLSRPVSPIVERSPDTVLPRIPMLDGDPKDPKVGEMWVNSARRAVRVAVPPTSHVEGAPPAILTLPLQSDSFVVQQYKINEYVNLVLGFAFAFALTFQTPVVVLLLGWSGIVDVQTLRRQRKYALLTCAIIAAVVTPPDAFSMLSLVVPMYLLYELGLFMLIILPADRVARGLIQRDAEPAP